MPCGKKIISNCLLMMCQISGAMKKNYPSAWFSTSLGRGIVVLSVSIKCNILEITSQYLIQILALLSCPILMWCPDYLLYPLCLLISHWNANTVHGIIVSLLSTIPSHIDPTDSTELHWACLLVLLEFHQFLWHLNRGGHWGFLGAFRIVMKRQ